jgi:hypothetical protein
MPQRQNTKLAQQAQSSPQIHATADGVKGLGDPYKVAHTTARVMLIFRGSTASKLAAICPTCKR